MKKLTEWSACALSEALGKGEVSAVEAVRAYLDEIARRDGEIRAYLTVTAEAALSAAEAADAARRRGEALSPLAGVPIALKDNLCTKGIRTTCASRMLENFVPPYDAAVVERLYAAGAVPLGKANMDEFAMGSSTENSAFFPTRNPVDPSRVPGGSSGGSAAAVAAGEAAVAIGSDTGGSIRQPAAFCGVVGMKPTYGLVSRYGLVAFASSLDQIGPLARTAADCALAMNVLAGHDRRDATSLSAPQEDYLAGLDAGVEGLRLALPKEYFGEGLQPAVKDAVLSAARRFEAMGAKVGEVSFPTLEDALPAYYVLSSAEASSNLARFDGVRYGRRSGEAQDIAELYCRSRSEGFGAEVKRRILLGTFVLSAGYADAYYKQALRVRTLIARDFGRIFREYDAILSPVAPTTAYRLGEKTADPMQMYLGDVYTVPVNIAGLPAVSLPCGKDEDGLPIGMQLIGPALSEKRLLRAAHTFETERSVGQ